MASQLSKELNYLPDTDTADSVVHQRLRRYPRLVSLQLNLNDPNPVTQIAQWIAQFPPPKSGNRRLSLPTFQLLGIEHLTRQPAAVQRLFFAHLQGIERHLSAFESGLLLWLPQPWFHALPQSAPDFWRCRTGTFEFIGDPTPAIAITTHPPMVEPEPPTQSSNKPSSDDQLDLSNPLEIDLEDLELADDPDPVPSDLWTILSRDLARLDESNGGSSAHDAETNPPDTEAQLQMVVVTAPIVDKTTEDFATPSPVLVTAKAAHQTASVPISRMPVTVKARDDASQIGFGDSYTSVNGKAGAAVVALATSQSTHTPPAQPPKSDPADHLRSNHSSSSSSNAAPLLNGMDLQPLSLLQQIEALHQQNAPPTTLADAYRALGNFYRDRIEQGDASPQNLRVAIHAYEQVLVWLHETSSLWTDVLNDLGNLYWMLSRAIPQAEEALGHLQQAIQAYQLALSKVNLQTQSHTYPMLQNNLGSAFADLARYQNPVENLQRAIQAYQQTLRYRKPESDPLRYASTQNNLGTAYWSLAQHQQPEVYLKQAIAAYSEALHHYKPNEEPLSYAMIQNNLGTAYWNLAQRERPLDWLRLALGAYQTALKYRTIEIAPTAFAATQNNLGTAYWHLANHTKDDPALRADYLLQAISAYEATLIAVGQLSTGSQAPALNFDLFATHNNLGLAHCQLATDPHVSLDAETQRTHLEVSLQQHLQALEGWHNKPELYKTAFGCLLQTIRALYNQCGLTGQNLALSKIPGHLLPEILAQL
jgi:tetratricopeptide (TPR) repeat protein